MKQSILAAPSYDVFPGVDLTNMYDWSCPNAQSCLYQRDSSIAVSCQLAGFLTRASALVISMLHRPQQLGWPMQHRRSIHAWPAVHHLHIALLSMHAATS